MHKDGKTIAGITEPWNKLVKVFVRETYLATPFWMWTYWLLMNSAYLQIKNLTGLLTQVAGKLQCFAVEIDMGVIILMDVYGVFYISHLCLPCLMGLNDSFRPKAEF